MPEPETFRRLTRLKVGEVVTREVVTIFADTPFKHVEQLMNEHNISNLILGVDGVIDVEPTLTYRFDDRNIKPPKELGDI
jgi:CBS domain-containing protein